MITETDTFEGGYTLLELVVVLVLMGLLMGIATPKVIQLYSSVEFSLERDDILFQLDGASFAVSKRGQTFKLQELLEKGIVSLPGGWQLDQSYAEDVVYTSLGYCGGGEARFTKDGRELVLSLMAPTCKPQVQ